MDRLLFLFLTVGLLSCQTASKGSSDVSPPTIILLGESHNKDQEKIYAYLESKKPHSVLLEIPINLFHSPNNPVDEVNDALNQNFVGWKFCKNSGSLCSGFDIQDNDQFNKETNLPEREQQFVNSFLKRLKSVQPSLYNSLLNSMREKGCETLQQINSEICDMRTKEKRRLFLVAVDEFKKENKLIGLKDDEVLALGEARWQKRNLAMAKNICNYAEQLRGETVVVIVGSEHRYILKQFLSECASLSLDPLLD